MSRSPVSGEDKQWSQRLRLLDLPRAVLALAACVPIFLALRIQTKHWVNIPIWDEWDTPGRALLQYFRHDLTWADLFGQHNESRKVIPRLIHIGIASVAGWDVRQGMVLTFLCACGVSALTLVYLRKHTGKATLPALFVWLLMNLMLFAPSQYENFLSGFIYEFFIPVLCLFGCVAVNLSKARWWVRVAANAAFALVATYTFAHGMLLWLLAVPIPKPNETSRSRIAAGWIVYLVSGVIAIATYFVGYFKPSVAPPTAGLAEWPEILAFMIVWLGAPLRSAWVSPQITGAIVAATIATAVSLALFVLVKNKAKWKSYYPWLLLLSFSLIGGFLTDIGRVNLGIDAVFNTRFEGFSSMRYNATSVFAYLAVFGLLYNVWTDWVRSQGHLRTATLIVLSSSCTLLAVTWTHLFAEGRTRVRLFQENRRRALAAITWIKVMPENPEIFWAYPYPEGFARHPLEMQQLGIINVPMVDEQLGAQVAVSPPEANFDYGSIDSVQRESGNRYLFTGWARNPENNRRADYVVLGWEDGASAFHPFTALLTGRLRLDVVQVFNAGSLMNSGFKEEIDLSKLPPEADIIRGWAVDFPSKKVFPLGGAVRLGNSVTH